MSSMQRLNLFVLGVLLSSSRSSAFQTSLKTRRQAVKTTSSMPTSSSVLQLHVDETDRHHDDRVQNSYKLSMDEINPIFRMSNGDKEKVINAHGLWCLFVTILTGPVWAAVMFAVDFYNKNIDSEWDPHRAVYDKTGKIWSKIWLSMTDSYPTSSGEVDFLKEGGNGACLYVANHASWLDIPVICTVLDPVFKFIAKGELAKVPCIGQQLVGGDHILIDREDRRSQLRTFKEGINWLKKGVPLMAFPEGQRSPDGRLIDFKGGLFSMAVKTGVPIVPLSISHTYAIMPSNALFPVQSGKGKLHVHVHEPIESTGRTDAELADLVRKAFLSELPLDHLPLNMEPEDMIASSAAKAIRVNSDSHRAPDVAKEDCELQQQSNHMASKDIHEHIITHHYHPATHNDTPNLPMYAIEQKEKSLEKV